VNKFHQQIAILDFGSQYTHLISRRVRDFSVLSRIYPANVKASILRRENLIGVILSGGPMSVYDETALDYDRQIFDLAAPILGLCYGHQLIGRHFGGKVKAGKVREYGFAKLKIKNTNKKSKILNQSYLFKGLKKQLTVWMSHGDSVAKAPPGFDILASTRDCQIAAMGNLERKIYGLQFHPEVHHTKDQDKILYNFVVGICGALQDWRIDDAVQEIIKDIRNQAKDKKVFMLVSGGVDSSVAFAFLEKALGKKNVIGLYINSGLMRKGESQQVKKDLAKAGFNDLQIADAKAEFLNRLKSISDPEKKRKIIGEAYLDVAERWFRKKWLLGQGTIYPDTVESGGTKHADTIKTHHNRIVRIQQMIIQGRIIEPLRNFYKDEVRAIGRKLGLPQQLVARHPFPGPGLGIRVLCSQKIGRKNLPRLKLNQTDFHYQILPAKSVGVQGDSRTYAHPLAVWGALNWKKLEKISTNITNTYRSINRVVWLLYPNNLKDKRFYQKASCFLTPERLLLLRRINSLVEKEIRKAGIYNKIWQFPVVLAPISLNRGESIILRPVESREAMTANFYKMNQCLLSRIINQIKKFDQIDAVFYDVTNKPPGTIEWE
jgi:GMP synthase (glutamine-hydrolysing)